MTATPRLAQCPRCSHFVLLAHTAGLAVAVDVAAVDKQRWVNAVVGGIGLWWAEAAPGGGYKRLTPLRTSQRPSWTVHGTQEGVQRLHAEHSCGALAQDMVPVPTKGADTGPHQASATSGGAPDGSRRPAAPAGARARSSLARYASHLHSDARIPGVTTLPDIGEYKPARPPRPVSCKICRKVIDQKKPFFGIHYDAWIWAAHEECGAE